MASCCTGLVTVYGSIVRAIAVTTHTLRVRGSVIAADTYASVERGLNNERDY
jgi:hypothetical protein